MADSIKKKEEIRELLTEAADMELDNELGSGLSDFNPIVTLRYRCGLVRTISAECIPSHKSCKRIRKSHKASKCWSGFRRYKKI